MPGEVDRLGGPDERQGYLASRDQGLAGGSIGWPSPLAASASPVPGATTSRLPACTPAMVSVRLTAASAREVFETVSQSLCEHFGGASRNPERAVDHER